MRLLDERLKVAVCHGNAHMGRLLTTLSEHLGAGEVSLFHDRMEMSRHLDLGGTDILVIGHEMMPEGTGLPPRVITIGFRGETGIFVPVPLSIRTYSAALCGRG